MRKGRSMILGVFFLLLGISILIKVIFHVDLPLARLGFALFLVYLGLRVLLGASFKIDWHGEGNTAAFSSANWTYQKGKDGEPIQYNSIFGSSRIDLTQIPEAERNQRVEINVVFGSVLVYLDPAMPVLVHTNSVFAEARTPDDNMVAFGTLNYRSPDAKSGSALEIHANAVFGSVKFLQKTAVVAK